MVPVYIGNATSSSCARFLPNLWVLLTTMNCVCQFVQITVISHQLYMKTFCKLAGSGSMDLELEYIYANHGIVWTFNAWRKMIN